MDCNLLGNLKTEMNRQRLTVQTNPWARKRQSWQEKDNIEETVTLANGNENYPFAFQFTTSLVEENLDRKQFRSNHFLRATNVCVVCSVLIFIILIALWMYFETICNGVG